MHRKVYREIVLKIEAEVPGVTWLLGKDNPVSSTETEKNKYGFFLFMSLQLGNTSVGTNTTLSSIRKDESNEEMGLPKA